MSNFKKMMMLVAFLSLILVIVVAIGLYNLKHSAQSGEQVNYNLNEENHSMEELPRESGEEEDSFDWDAYFNEGGYFGDYGDESINYSLEEVNSIYVQAEYATVHIQSSDDVDDFQVFTQIGSETDAISCKLRDGTLTIIQANLDDESETDGSYIEITVPAGKALTSVETKSSAGVASVKLNNFVKELTLSSETGTIYVDSILGNTAMISVGTGTARILSMDMGQVNLCCKGGSFQCDSLMVRELSFAELTQDGSMKIGLTPDTDPDLLMVTSLPVEIVTLEEEEE